MSKKANRKIDKLRRKHIWPSIVLLFVVMGIGFICFSIGVAFYVEYIIDSKMLTAHEKANEIRATVERSLSQGETYEDAFANALVSNTDLSVCILDKNNQVVVSQGDITIDVSSREEALSVSFGFENDKSDETYGFYWDMDDDNQAIGILSGEHPMKTIHQIFKGQDINNDNTNWYRATIFQFPCWVSSRDFVDGNKVVVKENISIQRHEVLTVVILGGCFLLVLFIVLLVLIGNVISNVHYQRRLTKLVSTDSVTGGNNWFYFSEHAKRILSRRRNATNGYAVVDFEWMKYRNFCGLHGTNEGEETLTKMLQFIQSKLSKKEICARYEKANLAILLRADTVDHESEIIEARIKNWIEELPIFLEHSNLIFHVGIYDVDAQFDDMGSAVRRRDVDVTRLYSNASVARASIEADNESGIKHFNQKMWDDQLWEHKVEDSMQRALENEEFLVYIQPKYNPVNEKLAGAEALIRWQSPSEGFLPPYRFIPIFEKSNFITKIDDYMISHVAKLQAEWISKGKQVVPVSVNVSRIHFAQPDLAEHIASLVDVYNVPHKYIEIELTESAFFDDKNSLLGTIKQLQSLGFEVSMDDFGAGYSSLNSLKDLPLDVLKLDADFFRGEAEGDRGEIVVSQAIDLAKHLNMRIVAEGIEKKEQVDFLADCGCDMIQGYYFAKPMPADEYEDRMSDKE